jgi:hypothetical protein
VIYHGTLGDEQFDELHATFGQLIMPRACFRKDQCGITLTICRVNIYAEVQKILGFPDISIARCASQVGR